MTSKRYSLHLTAAEVRVLVNVMNTFNKVTADKDPLAINIHRKALRKFEIIEGRVAAEIEQKKGEQ